MRTTSWFAAVGVVAISLSGAALRAGSINVDFNNGGATDQSPTGVTGPYATAGWNNTFNVGAAPAPLTGLLDDAGSPTTATFGFTQGGNATNGNPIYNSGYGAAGSANAGYTSFQQLYNGAASAQAGGYDQEVKITDVPYATFDVYVLVKAPVGNQGYGNFGYYDMSSLQMYTGATPGTTYYFGSSQQDPTAGSSFIQATSTNIAAPTIEANYVLYTGLTGGLGTSYSFDLHSPGNNGNPLWFGGDGRISGIQIVESVPEPVSLSALTLGGLGLLSRRRR